MNKDLANKFIYSWKVECDKQMQSLLVDWDNPSNYTMRMLYNSNESIINKVAEGMSLCCYSECRAGYYGIDAVFFKGEFKVENKGHETWLKKIEVAIEHENYCDDNLFQEISRLLTCNSSLKVLITYPDKKLKLRENYEPFIDNYKEMLKNINESILIILGFENDNIIDWKHYSLDESGLIEFKT